MEGSGYSHYSQYVRYKNTVNGVDYFEYGNPVTYSGTSPTAGKTIAVDRYYVPLYNPGSGYLRGTVEIYGGVGTRQAEDTGGGINNWHIDVYTGFGQSSASSQTYDCTYQWVYYKGNNKYSVDDTIEIVDNQIVFNDKTLTSSEEIKQFPSLSPDEKNIAFAYKMNLQNERWGKIGIISLTSGETKEIYLDTNYASAFLNVEWVNSKLIAITGYRNPSLNTYEIYNIETGKLEKQYFGIGFTWNNSKTKLYYVKPAPHFYNGDKGKNKIITSDDEEVYESPSNIYILGTIGISDNEENFIFFERDVTSNATNLISATKSMDKKIKISKKINWDNEVGKIDLSSDGSIIVKSRFNNLTYDLNSEKVLKVEANTVSKTSNPFIKK